MYPVSHEKPLALGQPDVDLGRPYFPDGHCTAWLKPDINTSQKIFYRFRNYLALIQGAYGRSSADWYLTVKLYFEEPD